jgi:lysophospholipase L1-like esterase
MIVQTKARIVFAGLAFAAIFDSRLSLADTTPPPPPPPPVGIVDDPCPAALAVPKVILDATETLLTPGPVDLSAFRTRLDSPEVHAFQAAAAASAKQDWPNLCKYRRSNQSLKNPPEAVFLGDSITENWQIADPAFFSEHTVDRGISGQTTPQMLLRFFDDVVNLHPKVVHILAGTNDVAGNTGPTRAEDFRNNIEAMVQLAKLHHIRVVLGSIPPAAAFTWRPEAKPAPTIKALNQWLQGYARANGLKYVDYFSALADANGGLKASLSADGVHPNRDGYAIMRPLALAAIHE